MATTSGQARADLRLVGRRPDTPACDGKWGWVLTWPKQRLVRTVNQAEQALHCGAEFDDLFIDYRQRGFSATCNAKVARKLALTS